MEVCVLLGLFPLGLAVQGSGPQGVAFFTYHPWVDSSSRRSHRSGPPPFVVPTVQRGKQLDNPR